MPGDPVLPVAPSVAVWWFELNIKNVAQCVVNLVARSLEKPIHLELLSHPYGCPRLGSECASNLFPQ